MSGLDRTRIAEVTKALMRVTPDARSRVALWKKSGIGSRTTVYNVLAGRSAYPQTYQALDDAFEIPPGTLELVGEGDRATLETMRIRSDAWEVIDRHLPGSGRNAAQK